MRINKSFIALTSSDASVSWSNITGTPTTLSGYGITDGVPTSRTLTINGVTYDLSANRTWTISTGTVTSLALATGTTGTDVNVSGSPITSSGTITLNIPDAGDSARGLITTGTQFIAGNKIFRIQTSFQGGLTSSNTIFLNAGVFSIKETTSPSTPSATFGFLYAKTDKKLWYKNSDGTDYDLTVGSGGTVTSVGLSSATSGVTIGSTPVTTSGTITLTIATASGSQNGLLSSTDWTTFNNKFTLPSLTSGSVLFSNGTTIAQDNSNFFWDNTNKRLGIGINTPSVMIEAYKSSANAEIYANYNNTNIVRLNASSNGTGYIGVIGGTGDLALGTTNYTTALVISGANGSVLINTSSNSGEKLQVNGTSKLYGNVTTYGENGIELLWSGNTINDQRQARIRPIASPSVFPYAGGIALDYYGYSGTAYQYYEGFRLDGYGKIKFNAYTSSTSFTGTAIANLQVDSSGNVITSGITDSGTYTPSLTNVANISSSSPELCTYTRIGPIVAVQGYLTLTPTSGSLTTTIGISLPIASNFNAGTDASGIFVSTSNDRFGGITPDQTNDRVEISFISSSNGTRSIYFSFQYQIK